MASPRPFVYVLAGVNGAGKSSVGGHLLMERGLDWYNPDTFTRELMARRSMSLADANAAAWQAGRAQLEAAMLRRRNFAFETTLGASTIPNLLIQASATHDVYVWYCGLASVEQHLNRIAARVARGGHDIPEAKVRERWEASRRKLVRLLPHLAHLQVFDNSADVARGEPIPLPRLVLEMARCTLRYPNPRNAAELASVPAWAAPIVEAAIQASDGR
ncbi:MAG: AAA family ATPase [Pseudomonadota bacterium]